MSSEALEHFLNENGFTPVEQEFILPYFKLKQYAKNAYFVEAGQRSASLGFIESGVFQYFYNHDGNELTTYVVGKEGFVAFLVSFLRNLPARESIRALTDRIIGLEYVSAGVYFLAQGELFAILIPDFPQWAVAGFLGSTLWLLWRIVIGIKLQKTPIN